MNNRFLVLAEKDGGYTWELDGNVTSSLSVLINDTKQLTNHRLRMYVYNIYNDITPYITIIYIHIQFYILYILYDDIYIYIILYVRMCVRARALARKLRFRLKGKGTKERMEYYREKGNENINENRGKA